MIIKFTVHQKSQCINEMEVGFLALVRSTANDVEQLPTTMIFGYLNSEDGFSQMNSVTENLGTLHYYLRHFL